MTEQKIKFLFNARTWRFYMDGSYIKLPSVILKLLYRLSFTVEEIPYLPGDDEIEGKSAFELRRRLGKIIGKESARELIECLSGLGYRFNPELLDNGLLVVKNPPTKRVASDLPFRYVPLDNYRTYSRKTGGFQEQDEEY